MGRRNYQRKIEKATTVSVQPNRNTSQEEALKGTEGT